MLRRSSRRTAARIALALAVGASLAACGGDAADDVPDDAVAIVNDTPITRASFDRWVELTTRENAFAGADDLTEEEIERRVLSTLIRAEWVRGEAEELGIAVPQSELEEEWERTTELEYVGGKDFEQYMREVGFTEEELRFRIETGKTTVFLTRASQARAGGAEAPDVDEKMLAYNRDYTERWKALTVCGDLRVPDCSNHDGGDVGTADDAEGAADAGR